MVAKDAAHANAFDPAAYHYDLDPSLIAQSPSHERGASRMLVALEQATPGKLSAQDRRSGDLARVLAEHDLHPLVVVNNSKVVPARMLLERRGDGRSFELLFCAPAPGMGPGSLAEAWVRGAKRLKEGDELFAGGLVLKSLPSPTKGADTRSRYFLIVEGDLMESCAERASLPLPPYIERPDGLLADDTQRYQTVYAQSPGSIAAPTAGLHFDRDALASLDVVEITLHVGPGTFLPIQSRDLRRHTVPPERASISAEAAARIERARAQGRPILAVGTTVTRTLEYVAREHGGAIVEFHGEADLVILPGHRFDVVDLLLTNFHLPASSLLVLVAAFAGREQALSLYRYAVEQRYRFYSYGDCMLVRRGPTPTLPPEVSGTRMDGGQNSGRDGGRERAKDREPGAVSGHVAGTPTVATQRYLEEIGAHAASWDVSRLAEVLASLPSGAHWPGVASDDRVREQGNAAFWSPDKIVRASQARQGLRQEGETSTWRPGVPGSFEVLAKDGSTHARAAVLETAHGPMHTPCFMPVGTYGAIKGLTPAELRACGSQTILGNAYHLSHRPGAELVARLGGLHAMMGWPGPILTDSGGYQVFSLRGLQKIDDQGVDYQTHFDGSRHRMTPRSVLEVQAALGSDICMILDHCPPGDAAPKLALAALERTQRWAEEVSNLRGSILSPSQLSFCIAQGGTDLALRERALQGLVGLDFDGVALGGLSVGESIDKTHATMRAVAPWMPTDRPRYVMGIGTPLDLLVAIESGVDMFDCVMPTRHARNGQLFTWRGKLNIRHARYRDDPLPPEGELHASIGHPWLRGISRAYLRHLHVHDDPLYVRLATLQNLWFFHSWVASLREAMMAGRLEERRALHWAVIARHYLPKAG